MESKALSKSTLKRNVLVLEALAQAQISLTTKGPSKQISNDKNARPQSVFRRINNICKTRWKSVGDLLQNAYLASVDRTPSHPSSVTPTLQPQPLPLSSKIRKYCCQYVSMIWIVDISIMRHETRFYLQRWNPSNESSNMY
ncbi:hypothetical protein LXL04_007201 [Taraxacum kok-saghyz]